jgi:hypothetical protein
MAHLSLAEVGRGVADGWAAFVQAARNGEVLRLPAGSLGIAGESFAAINTGFIVGPDGVTEAIGRFAARLRERGLPGEIYVTSTVEAEAEAAAGGLGLSRSGTLQLMCCRAAEARRAETPFAVRRVTDDAGVRAAAEVLGDACGIDPAWCERMLGPGFPRLEHAGMFLALEGEAAIAACGSAVTGRLCGLYAVGTRTAHRGRGAGHAAVAGALDYHIAAGAHLFALLSAPGAERLYADLGFTAVDAVSVWSVDLP